MDPSKENLVHDLDSFSEDHFDGRPFFGCVYGSYPCETAQTNSDLDVFFATPDITPNDIRALTRFIVQYHIEHDLMQDEEVPYDNKLVVSYDDMLQAVQLKGLSEENGRIVIPPIVKEASFLASLSVRYRLLFNALTSPHEFFGNDYEAYMAFKTVAENQLMRLALSLHDSSDEMTIKSLVEVLFRNRHGDEGEMFLGYKRNPKSIEYVMGVVRNKFGDLKSS